MSHEAWRDVDLVRVAHGTWARPGDDTRFYGVRAGLIVATSYAARHVALTGARVYRANPDGSVVHENRHGEVVCAWVVPFGQSARAVDAAETSTEPTGG